MLRRTPVASLIMSQKSQGRPDVFASTFKVQRSAVGSGSGRHETARPMSQLGRLVTSLRGTVYPVRRATNATSTGVPSYLLCSTG